MSQKRSADLGEGFRTETTKASYLPEPVAPAVQYDCAPEYLIDEYRRSGEEARDMQQNLINPEVEKLYDRDFKKDLAVAIQNTAPIALGLTRVGLMTYGVAALMAGANPLILGLMIPGLVLQGNKVLKDIHRAFNVDPSIRKKIEEAMRLAAAGDFDEAESALKYALELDINPDNRRNADLWFTLGQVYVRHGKFRKAMLAFAKSSVLLREQERLVQQTSDGSRAEVSKRGMGELMICACIDTFINESEDGIKEWSEIVRDEAFLATKRFMEFARAKDEGGVLGRLGKKKGEGGFLSALGQDFLSADYNQYFMAKVMFLSAKSEILADPSNRNLERLHETLKDAESFVQASPYLAPEEKINALLEQARFYLFASTREGVTDIELLKAGLALLDGAADIASSNSDEFQAVKLKAFGGQFARHLLANAHRNNPELAAGLKADLEERMGEIADRSRAMPSDVPFKAAFINQCYESCYQLAGDPEQKHRYAKKVLESLPVDGDETDPILRMRAQLRYLYTIADEEARQEVMRLLKAELAGFVESSTNPIMTAYLLRYLAGMEPDGEQQTELKKLTGKAFGQASMAADDFDGPIPFLVGNRNVLHDAVTSSLIFIEHGMDAALAADDPSLAEELLVRMRARLGEASHGPWDAKVDEYQARLHAARGEIEQAISGFRGAAHKYTQAKRRNDAQRVEKQLEIVGGELSASDNIRGSANLDMRGFERLQSQVIETLGRLAEFDRERRSGTGGIAEQVEKVRRCRFVLAIVGEFSSGKSTFINALIGSEVLPAASIATTSIVNLLLYGDSPGATVIYGDGRREDVSLEGLKEYVTEKGNPGNSKKISEVRIRYPLPLLRSGITVIDTPGVGSIVEKHSEVTYGLIPHADAVILLSNCREPYSKTERQFLLKLKEEIGERLFVVINKIDTIDEVALEKVQRFATEKIGEDLHEPRIYPLSSYFHLYAQLIEQGDVTPENLSRKRILREITDPDQLRALSRFAALEKELTSYLSRNKGAIVLKNALDRARGYVVVQIARLNAEKLALAENYDSLEKKRDEFVANNRQLLEQSKGATRDLENIAEQNAVALREDVVREYDIVVEQVGLALRTLGSDALTPQNVQSILTENLERWIHQNITRSSKHLQNELNRVIDKVDHERGELFDDYNSMFVGTNTLVKLPTVSAQFDLGESDGVMGLVGTVGAGALLGYLSVALLGPLGLIPAFFGSSFVGRLIQSKTHERRLDEIMAAVRYKLPEMVECVLERYRSTAKKSAREMGEQLSGAVEQLNKELQDQLEQTLEHHRQGEEKMKARQSQISDELSILIPIEEAIEQSVAAVAG